MILTVSTKHTATSIHTTMLTSMSPYTPTLIVMMNHTIMNILTLTLLPRDQHVRIQTVLTIRTLMSMHTVIHHHHHQKIRLLMQESGRMCIELAGHFIQLDSYLCCNTCQSLG